MKAVIDRFEGEYAVLFRSKDEVELKIPRVSLPEKAKAGDWLHVKVNINKANASALQKIHGVGSALSERIVAYREQNGPFRSIEDIMNVRGMRAFGDSRFERMREDITV